MGIRVLSPAAGVVWFMPSRMKAQFEKLLYDEAII